MNGLLLSRPRPDEVEREIAGNGGVGVVGWIDAREREMGWCVLKVSLHTLTQACGQERSKAVKGRDECRRWMNPEPRLVRWAVGQMEER